MQPESLLVPALNDRIELVLGAIALLGAVAAAWRRWIKPFVGKVRAVFDVLLGRDAVVDSITGEELAGPVLGIGQRMAVQETNTADLHRTTAQLAEAVGRLVEQGQTLRHHKRLIDDHERRIGALEDARTERVVAQAEAAAAWTAVAAAQQAPPPVEPTRPDAGDDEAPDLD